MSQSYNLCVSGEDMENSLESSSSKLLSDVSIDKASTEVTSAFTNYNLEDGFKHVALDFDDTVKQSAVETSTNLKNANICFHENMLSDEGNDAISEQNFSNETVGLETSLDINGADEAQEAEVLKKAEPTKDESTKPVVLCRLCAIPCPGSASVLLFRHPPHHPEVIPKNLPDSHDDEAVGDILSMIKATLPINVSCCDALPKQVCKTCVERLRLSHAFIATVLKAESQLNSLRTQHKTTDFDEARSSSNSLLAFDCQVCKEKPALLSKYSDTETIVNGSLSWGEIWGNVVIKDEPQDHAEPSQEELEKSYNDFFGGHQDFKMEERITLKPSKPFCSGRRPRGRPRSRSLKVTPRGRRGRRSLQTTVEKILELSGAPIAYEDYGLRIRSRKNNPASEALTQCLLCERWLPGAASCLQHSLGEHMDCGAFLCPRCPRDDFPGDFELIQHYQESHCPDLELYEVFQAEKNYPSANNNNKQLTLESQTNEENGVPCEVKQEDINAEPDSPWPCEVMDFETLHTTPPAEPYESQDEVSSNLSELVPRSLTSHSALYEEESNSISTHGSDSNLATEDISSRSIPNKQQLPAGTPETASSLGVEVSFDSSPCTAGVSEFPSDLKSMEEGGNDNEKPMEDCKQNTISSQESNNICLGTGDSQRDNFKSLQDESQDSIRADELCGFQEAINEKSQEVNLNGSDIHYESQVPFVEGGSDIGTM